MRMGIVELVIILLVIIFIFGPKQLPKVAAALRSSVEEFRKGEEERDGGEE